MRQLKVSLNGELEQKLCDAARESGQSVSGELRDRLEDSFELTLEELMRRRINAELWPFKGEKTDHELICRLAKALELLETD